MTIDVAENLQSSGAVEFAPRIVCDGAALVCPAIIWPEPSAVEKVLIKYSRAVHKMVFEWYAHHYYVTRRLCEYEDPEDPHFDPIRSYVRRGTPPNTVRAFARYGHGINDDKNLLVGRAPNDGLLADINLMGTHWIGMLTGTGEEIARTIRKAAESADVPSLFFHEVVEGLGKGLGAPLTSTWIKT